VTVQRLATLPEAERLFERRATALEAPDDVVELRAGLLEAEVELLAHVPSTSSIRAPRRPSARRIRTWSPRAADDARVKGVPGRSEHDGVAALERRARSERAEAGGGRTRARRGGR
jgi:hypothetical protein